MVLFKDRKEAGKKLAKMLIKFKEKNVIVLAIPRGGIPVASQISKELGIPLDVIIPRKIPIPWNPEAGFGAISFDGTLVLNKPLVAELGLTQEEINVEAKKVLEEIKRRQKIYRGDKPFPKIKGKIVILVDDVLASGYTMIAAIRFIKKSNPKKIIVAVPVSPRSSVERIKPLVDDLICFYTEEAIGPFAVASFYEKFPDLTDEEVIDMLANLHKSNTLR